jgi:hypothetical protein
MHRDLSQDDRFRIYLLSLSIIATFFVLITTAKYGAGVSSDAARNLSTADSLLAGRGFVDMVGAPFVLWPPLYPLVLAALSWLTRWDTFRTAWYLNAVLYPVNIWLSGWLLYRTFRQRPVYAVAGALILLLSRSMLRIHANVASEPLFETLILLFFFAAATYLRDSSWRALWSMCLLAGLATLQRYLGVALIAIITAVVYHRGGWRALAAAAAPIVLSMVPIAAWAILHNLPASASLFGPRELGAMLPLENIGLSLTKILWWFIPRTGFLDSLVLRPWIPVGAFVLLLLLINRRKDWRAWWGAINGDYVWPGLLFSALYFLLLAFTVVTADHLDLTSDRYYVVLLPFVVALLLLTLDTLVFLRLPAAIFRYVLVGLAALWLIYPVYGIQAYLRQALIQGEPTNYNIANSANFRELSVVKAGMAIVARDPQALIYSNYVNIVWFIYHHPVAELPFEDSTLPKDQRLAALRNNYPGWPSRPGYIVWFTPNQYHHVASPDELATIADLSLLFDDETGQIYSVSAGPTK